ncbi:uncharacterized protein Z519_00915 [Cladophialophora bantiana CBS 173.52]|uniref:Uncharacterized protein n=1 Tax=Cladophialophora bantiana (strain ATCC 10958 / CBS 173.52 / CDC B-1940 / NIH 8579) TaxID=1442370 RepID=A0A0D2GLI3_CLAB1|nr:uncharacterized protein Z519_00915 [Cladophialophora bantiana CBS 173.52]KIW99252.1 hypothetical protein Z519_00915 [Cladophialophora bantiana CBS 173.52]
MTQPIHLYSATPHDLSIYGSFTKGIYRDGYPTIDPTRPELSQNGKVFMITGTSKGIGRDKLQKRKIVYVSSGISYIVNPGQSAYSFSKLIINQLAAYAHAESNEEIQVQAIAVHPGIFVTDILEDIYRFYAVDTNELAEGIINWAASDEAEFMSGRYTTANVRLCVSLP